MSDQLYFTLKSNIYGYLADISKIINIIILFKNDIDFIRAEENMEDCFRSIEANYE